MIFINDSVGSPGKSLALISPKQEKNRVYITMVMKVLCLWIKQTFDII